MELFISSDISCYKTIFLEILCSYLKYEDRKIGKLIKIDLNSQGILKIEKLPILIDSNKTAPTLEDEIEIAKSISQESGFLPLLFGITDKEKETINNFLNHIIKDLELNKEKVLSELNTNLLFNTFLEGFLNVTILDLFCFSIIATQLKQFSNAQKEEFCNVIRWADHIQNLKGIKEKINSDLKLKFCLPYSKFTLEDEEVPEKSKKDKKKDKKKEKQENKDDDKEEKKENKENKKNKQQQPEVHPMSKVDIRVGKIVNIFPNPEGDKLYNEEIDVGNGEVRKIASGLREFVKIEELKDSLVVVICNLEPRNLKGWTSHGMILCANGLENNNKFVEPLRPPEGSQPGDLVYIGDLERNPVPDKKCPWSKVAKDLIVNDNFKATYKGEYIWKTDKGEITVKKAKGGNIS